MTRSVRGSCITSGTALPLSEHEAFVYTACMQAGRQKMQVAPQVWVG